MRALVAAGLVAAGLGLAWPGRATAQGPCDSDEVRQYVAALPWPRTSAPPPGAWLGCLSTLQRDDPYKHTVFSTFGALRSRKPAASREPTEDDRRLFAGLQPAIDQRLLRTWQPHIGIGRPEQGLDNPAYQAFLGALTYIVLDRGAGLEKYGVEPVRGLIAVAGRRDGAALERALLAFRGVTLWSATGAAGPSLGELREGFSRLPAALSARLGDEIRTLPVNDVYWKRLDQMLATSIADGGQPTEPRIPPAGPTPTPAIVVLPVTIPPECPPALRKAVESCPPRGGWERCAALRAALAEEVGRLRRGLGERRAALPADVDYGALEGWLDAAGRLALALGGAPGVVTSEKLETQLKALVDASRRIDALEAVVVYRGAVGSLVRGRSGEARRSLESALRSARARPPQLVAAYLATRFWQEGSEGVRKACDPAGGFDCGGPEVVRELRLLEPIVRLAPGTIRP